MSDALSTDLAKYDRARHALAEAFAVDEVLEIKNQAAAWAAYARQAKDRELEVQAMHIRFRAIRRLGELILAQKETVGLAKGGQPYQGGEDCTRTEPEQVESRPPTLAEAGIDRKLSSQAQRMAAIAPERFETLLGAHRDEALGGAPKVSADLMRVDSEEQGRAHRRNLAAELSGRTIDLPTGRKYPAWYVDLPWRREGGVTGRSYENHYPTMAWPEILAFLKQARDLLLPDAWGFFWIPRAHLLALVEIELEVTLSATGEVVLATVEMPLAWAIAKAAGFDSYSTCFVWTKTDEQHPDEAGGAILVRDQDELLLMFKRGRGLPKPAGDEKFGSNHRERSRLLGHSRKPEHFRRMIATMVGTDLAGEPLPVMEFFARVDADNPLPRNWAAWGNQSGDNGPSPQAPETCDGLANPDRQIIVDDVAAGEVMDGSPPEPALPPGLPSEANGKVDALPISPDLPAPAVPPADRPGSLFDPLEIPAFLRRAPAHERTRQAAAPVVEQRELDLARRDALPAEIVDGATQTRLPLTSDEIEMQANLRKVVAGETVDWSALRHLVGADFVSATSEKLVVTEAGEAFLAQLVAPAQEISA